MMMLSQSTRTLQPALVLTQCCCCRVCAVCMCVLCVQAGSVSLWQFRFHLGLLPAFILRDWLGVDSSKSDEEGNKDMRAGTGDFAENADATFEFYMSWLHPSVVFLILLVPISIVLLFIAALVLLDRMFAVAMCYMFFLAMLLCWTMLRWKFEAWRFTLKVKLLFAFVMATTVAFEL
jgi:hypothetical protein